jgi:peptidoglycan biosynthesis/recognition FemAB-like protein
VQVPDRVTGTVGVHRLPDSAIWGRRAVEPFDREGRAREWDRGLSIVARPAPLTQGWAWGEVQASVGWKPERLEVPGAAPVLVLTQGAGPVRWGYVPRGPVACSALLLEALIDWSRRNGLARLRVEPERGPELCGLLSAHGFRRTADAQPSHTRLVPLGDAATLLASFHRTTRYNVHHAERSGVTVDEGCEAVELALHVAASAARAGVNLPGRRYFELLLRSLAGSRTFVARYRGKSLCALLVAVHDARAYYLYSGSNRTMHNLKAMDLAIYRAMRYAWAAGCRDFDLWGVEPASDPRHPWHGFSEFKRGFGGEVVEYAGTWDVTLSKPAEIALEAKEHAEHAYRRIRNLSHRNSH